MGESWRAQFTPGAQTSGDDPIGATRPEAKEWAKASDQMHVNRTIRNELNARGIHVGALHHPETGWEFSPQAEELIQARDDKLQGAFDTIVQHGYGIEIDEDSFNPEGFFDGVDDGY